MKALSLTIALLLITSLSAKDVLIDTTTSLLWQDGPDNEDNIMTFYEAEDYCAKLVIAEYHDFRIPTLNELQTIIDYKNYKPAVLDGFLHVDSETYWSTTQFYDDSSEVWVINFKKGERTVKGKHYSRNIRCVSEVK